MRHPFPPAWITRDIWLIMFSAFFADLGYQGVMAVFPLFLIQTLGAPPAFYGLAMAVAYGFGALFAFAGGRLGDRVGHKPIAVLGNFLIPLLSLSGLASGAPLAAGFLALGWWARNFRTPSRRALLVHRVDRENLGTVFGYLHALDVGGAMLAGLWVFFLAVGGAPLRTILLFTALPLVVSTLCLLPVREGPPDAAADPPQTPREERQTERSPVQRTLFYGILTATLLFGFTYYSEGFPVLTVAHGTQVAPLGLLAFAVLQGTSAVSGFLTGGKKGDRVRRLALSGYLLAAGGSAALAIAFALHLGTVGLFLAVAVFGTAMGAVETLEPALMATISPKGRTGSGMGALTAGRSLGLFVANLALGLLYGLSPAYSYGYAAMLGVAAAAVLLWVDRRRVAL